MRHFACDGTPSSFRRFTSKADAYTFAKEHCSTCQEPGEKTHRPSWNRSAATLLALQEALDSGEWRVVIEPDDDDDDLSWDDTGEVRAKLESGEYACVGVVLERRETWRNERTGETEERWEDVDSLWSCIGPHGDPQWQAVAADMFPR
jgi:hypothetical protein